MVLYSAGHQKPTIFFNDVFSFETPENALLKNVTLKKMSKTQIDMKAPPIDSF